MDKRILGKWVWVDGDRISDRILEFIKTGDSIKFACYEKGNTFSHENLSLDIETENDGKSKSYFVTNFWSNKNGNKFFSFEAQFVDNQLPGTFIATSEWEIIDDDTLKQKHSGFCFDYKEEKWVNTGYEMLLKRVE